MINEWLERCPSCGGVMFDRHDPRFGPDTIIKKCARCGRTQLSPRPTSPTSTGVST